MPDHWTDLTLGDIADFQSGGTPGKSEADYWDGDIPWISGATMDVTRLRNSDRKVTELGARNGTSLAQPGWTLILVRGMSLHSEVRIGHVMRPLTFNQDVKALTPRAGIDPWFLTYGTAA